MSLRRVGPADGHIKSALIGYCLELSSVIKIRVRPYLQLRVSMAIVSITRLRVRSWRYLPPFLFYALRSARQARHSQGNVATSLLRDRDRTFWTCTVWTTESAMKDFMLAGTHRQAMRKLLEWCDEASLVRWEQEDTREPSWLEAHQKLQAQGRRSKVNHPSPAHESFQIRTPGESAM